MNTKMFHTNFRQKVHFYKSSATSFWRGLTHIYFPFPTETVYQQIPSTNEKTADDITQKITRMKEKLDQVWSIAKLPPQNRNTLSVTNYHQSLVRKNTVLDIDNKKEEFIATLTEETKRILGNDIAESVAKQLEHNHSISTAQHFTPVSSPNTLNATVQTAFGYIGQNDPAHQNIIVLSCSNISFDNTYFPRGVTFHTKNETTMEIQQLMLFPRKVRPLPLIFHPGYDTTAIEKIKDDIQTLFSTGIIDTTTKENLMTVLTHVYGNEWVIDSPTYTDQITKTNFLLWKKIFEKTPNHVPNLVFLSQEEIVLKLLEKYHLSQDTVIHKLLFNPEYLSLAEKYFNNIQGGFSLEKQTGSFLFWAKPQGEKYRVQLFRNGQTLSTPDGSYVLPLTPEAIQEALKKQELIPTTVLSLTILSCYYGIILTGGLDQPRYHPQIQQAYMQILKDMQHLNPEDIVNTPTSDNTITRPCVGFIENHFGVIDPITGLDLCIYESSNTEKVVDAAKNVTLDNLHTRLLPVLYRWYIPKEVWEEDLLQVTMQDIDATLNNNQKIPSWITLS